MLKNYFKIAWRNIMRNKAYAAINVVGLSLGIASGILIFSIVSYHFSFDKFHLNRDRIYRVVTEFHELNNEYQSGVPQPLGKAFSNDYTVAEQVARVRTQHKALVTVTNGTDVSKFNEDGNVAFADASFFRIFNFPLVQGDQRSALTQPNSAIITQKIAQKYFGSSEPIGKVIKVDNGTTFKVTGILKDIPANTDRQQQIYLSYPNLKDYDPELASDHSWGHVSTSMQCFLLLKPGVTASQVNRLFVQFAKKHLSAEDAKITIFKLQPLADIHFNPIYGADTDIRYLYGLACIGGLLIVTACVNFVNLANAQALSRAKEVGVRKVMGGQPVQLFWQFIAETALITLFSAGAAYALSEAALPYVNSLFHTGISINLLNSLNLFLFIGGVVVVVVFLSGSYPALVLARFKPMLALRGKISQRQIGGFSLRRILVVGQFAISQALIIGAVVIAGQMRFSENADPGFNKAGVVLLPVPVPDKMKMNTLRSRLATMAGVKSVSLCSQPPATDHLRFTGVTFDNNTKPETWDIMEKNVDHNYIPTFGLKVVAGRNLFPSDTINEFVVNEAVLKKLNIKSPQDILGRMIHINGNHENGPVVGVVKDFYNQSFRSEIDPICMSSNYYEYNFCAVKTDLNHLKSSLVSFEQVWNETYPDQLYSYQFFDDEIARFYEQDITMLKLVEGFAGIAILIGCMGLYGLISFMAIGKTKEIGVRKVLGASVQSIVWLFGKEFSRLLLIAFAVAAPVAAWVMHGYLQDFKYRITIGPGIFLLSIATTFVIAVATVGYRSVKAAIANPVKSLRSE